MTFAEYLGLVQPDRDTLEPNAERDPELYQDLDGNTADIERLVSKRAPKVVIQGQYGTGKTHLLHVAKSRLLDPARFTPVYVKLEARGKVGDSRYLHGDILAKLEAAGVLQHAYSAVFDPGEVDGNLKNAFELLRHDPKDADARAWLFAHGPTPSQARKKGFSTRLADYAGGVQYEKIWRLIGDAYRRATELELVLLIDESETFQDTIDATRVADLGAAMREMFDTGNKSYGVLLGLTAPKARGQSHPLLRSDVATRIQNVLVSLRGFDGEVSRRRFLDGLIQSLLGPGRTFLTGEALAFLATEGPELCAHFMVGVDRDPVQREYVKLLDRLAQDAFRAKQPLPLDVHHLEQWVLGQWM
jgi:hypothetical protein